MSHGVAPGRASALHPPGSYAIGRRPLTMEPLVARPELGTKRLCPNCGAKYYDLNHDPITCPKCNALFATGAVAAIRPETAKEEEEDDDTVDTETDDVVLVPLEEAEDDTDTDDDDDDDVAVVAPTIDADDDALIDDDDDDEEMSEVVRASDDDDDDR